MNEQNEIDEVVRDLRCVAKEGWICAAAADLIDQLRQRVAEAGADIEILETCVQLQGYKLALAEQDARRLDWLEAHPNELRFEPFSRSGRAWTCCPSTKIGNDGRPHSDVDRFATARAAIDAAIDASGD